MTIDRRLLAGALGLALVLAACGGASTASSGTERRDRGPDRRRRPRRLPPRPKSPPKAPRRRSRATEAPTDDSGSGAGQVNDLAAMLPEKAGDLTFERVGYDGDQLGIFGAAAGLNSEELDPILKANGKTINDINFAIATATGGHAPAPAG